MSDSKMGDIRNAYARNKLELIDLETDPVSQFSKWFDDARNEGQEEVNAMALATVNADMQPSVRTVLMKDITNEGFVFFTNYLSRKGNDIEDNPKVALSIFWHRLERQIRIEGTAKKISAADSDSYFSSRPEGSRLGAWASPQSKVVESREFLLEKQKEFVEKFKDKEISRPEFWGGYVVIPEMIEFWQGRDDRMHDRFRYKKVEGNWKIERLAP